MNTHQNDDDQAGPDGTWQPARPDVPTRVRAGLDELYEQRVAAQAMPRGNNEEHATYRERYALIVAREAGWWGLLAQHAYCDPQTHSVYGRAAFAARFGERDSALRWRDSARTWRAFAEQDRVERERVEQGRGVDEVDPARRGRTGDRSC